MRSLVCPNIAHLISARLFWNVVTYIAQRWLILTWSVQNIKNMFKLKGVLLTNEILRDLRLRWVSDGYLPTLDSPVGARFFSAIPCHASQTWCDWELCSWSVFPIITAVEYEVLCNFEIHRWSILLISILLILMIAPLHIFMLYIHPWARVVFHVQLHQLMRYAYPNIVGVFTAESLT